MSPVVSVVIPVFNREPYIAAAIGSVLNQTYPNFELIVWDDGSTDRTADIALTSAKGDPRVRVIRAEHRGVCESLNGAAREASGRYLGWVDSDDALAPTALERTATLLDANPDVGMAYTKHEIMDESGSILGLGERSLIPYSKERLLVDFMTFHFRLIRRELFENIGGIDETIPYAEDYDLCLRLSEVTKISHIPEPLYFYRVHPGAISTTHRMEQIEASRNAVERALVRQGLADDFCLRLELTGRYKLRRKAQATNQPRRIV